MRAIITGSKGFIGKAFAEATTDIFQEQILVEKDILEGDWRKLLRLHFLDKPDAVFHFGACSDTMSKDSKDMLLKNVIFSNYLADLCEYFEVPFIYSSSASVYGKKQFSSVKDDYSLSLYADSKLIAEQYAIKSQAIGLRYFNVYGYDESHKGNMASIAYQSYRKYMQGQNVFLFKGKPRRDFVYVKDVISANLHAFEHYNYLRGDFYDVGSGTPHLFEDVLNCMGIPFWYYDFYGKVPEHYQYYTKATKFMMKWTPKWSLEQGLSDYLRLLSY